jgi:MFS family permease
VIGGVLKLPIAKMLNLWGRAEGLLVFTIVYVVGIVILASCNGPTVFATGYILYWIGYDALYLILDIFIADTFGLRNRAFAFGFASTPFICTAFTGPLAAQSFLEHVSWRWAYGAFAIIIPAVFVPLMLLFKFYQRQAEEMGVYRRRPSGRSVGESFIYYLKEFDSKWNNFRVLIKNKRFGSY